MAEFLAVIMTEAGSEYRTLSGGFVRSKYITGDACTQNLGTYKRLRTIQRSKLWKKSLTVVQRPVNNSKTNLSNPIGYFSKENVI